MMLDILIVAMAVAGVAFGWMARSDKADRDCDRAYQQGYADAVKHYGR